MIRILSAAAIAATALTGAAQANVVLTPAQVSAIEMIAPGANISGLSDGRKAAIVNILQSGSDSNNDKTAAIRGLVQ